MSDDSSRKFYDRISTVYDFLADRSEHDARERGLEALAVGVGEAVLEIGYGTGHNLVALARAVGPGVEVHGIDISPGMRDVARKRLADTGLVDRVSLDIGDARALPYDDDRFDVVSLSFTLELFALDDIPTVLAGIRRVVRPGGRVGVVSLATPPDGEHESVLTRTYRWMHRHFPHIIDCQPIDVVGSLETAALDVRSTAEMKIWTIPVMVVVASNPAEAS